MFRIREAAGLAGVSTGTLARWAGRGRIRRWPEVLTRA